MTRVLLVADGTAWFLRRVRAIEYDLDRAEKVYRCDLHLGGPYSDLREAQEALAAIVQESSEAAP